MKRGRPRNPIAKVAKSSLNLRMSDEAIIRLKIHSLSSGMTASDVVEQMIRDHIPERQIVTKEEARC